MKKFLTLFMILSGLIFAAQQNYYHLEGMLGNISVSMELNIFSDSSINAVYSYDKFGEPMFLYGNLDKDKLVLIAQDESEKFKGTLVNGKFEGDWVMKNKTLKFSLTQSYKNSLSVEELKNLNMNPVSLSSKSDNYTTSTTIYYNKNNLTVAEEFNYYYTGGAHGNYSVSYKTYDKISKSLVSYYDFFNYEAYDVLAKLIKKEIKSRDIFTFEESDFVTENVYFTEKGIMFVYNPYEIASYAQGVISIFISYDKLPKDIILNNEITKRFIK